MYISTEIFVIIWRITKSERWRPSKHLNSIFAVATVVSLHNDSITKTLVSFAYSMCRYYSGKEVLKEINKLLWLSSTKISREIEFTYDKASLTKTFFSSLTSLEMNFSSRCQDLFTLNADLRSLK